MNDTPVNVTARIRAKSGMEKRVKEELLRLIAPTRNEKGCISFDLHQSTEDPSLFLFYENWVSEQALNEHLEKPYLKAFFDKKDELFTEGPEIKLWRKIEI